MLYRILVIAVIFVAVRLDAQPLRHYVGSEITVLDSNAERTKGIVAPTISSSELKDLSATDILDGVSAIYPSLDVHSYGSLGSVALATYRGLPTEYVSLEFAGFKLTNAQNNLSDLGLINADILGSVGISSSASRAGIAASAGNVAIGASPVMYSNSGARIEIGSDVTSYNDNIHPAEETVYLRAAEKLSDEVSVSLAASNSSSDGNYPFMQAHTDGTTTEILRSNNDAHLVNATANIEYHPLDNFGLEIVSLYSKSDRGLPGAATIDYVGASSPFARQLDELYLLGATLKHKPSESFEYNFSAGFRSQFETYDDPEISAHDRYTNGIFSAQFDGVTHTSKLIDLCSTLAFERNSLSSNENYSPTDSGSIFRNIYRANIGAKFFSGNFDATAFLKTEKYSDNTDAVVLPQVSLKYRFDQAGITFGASYTKLYHNPTFNELYWKVGGNPNLLPEHGEAFEFVADLSTNSHWSIKAAAFYNSLENQIIWQESDGIVWTPMNIQSSRSYGAECSAQVSADLSQTVTIKCRVGLTVQRTENLTPNSINYGNELPYASPLRENLAIISSIKSIGDITFFLDYRGHRYPDYAENYSTELPPYHIINLTFRSAPIQFFDKLSCSISVSIANLFDSQYAEIPQYPMPGREHKFGVSFIY